MGVASRCGGADWQRHAAGKTKPVEEEARRGEGDGEPEQDREAASSTAFFRFEDVESKHAIDFRLITAVGRVLFEPCQNIGIQTNSHRLLQGPIQVAPSRMHPVFYRRLRNVSGINLIIRQRRQLGQLFQFRSAKVLPAHKVSFPVGSLSVRR
jgi:hypothetical protein